MTFEINLTITVEPNKDGLAGETTLHSVLTYNGDVQADESVKYPNVLLAYKQAGDYFYDMLEELVVPNLLNLKPRDKSQLN